MGKVLALANQKGGVGKTTAAIELSSLAAAQKEGSRVLVIDLDSQCNATAVLLGRRDFPAEESSFALLRKEKLSSRHLHPTSKKELFVIPGSIDLIEAESFLLGSLDGFFRLQESLSPLKKEFSLIFLDCPPSLSVVTINALVSSDFLLIPLQVSKFSLEGLTAMKDTVATVQKRYNPQLKIAGAFLTMYDSRTNLAQAMVPEIRQYIPLFKTGIPRSVLIEEAHLLKQDIFSYAPKSKVAEAFRQLFVEVMDAIQG
ncbi:MAG: ParA family protein [Leptospiraceae bacterium]|nr:ParA family protein [Leptospiraceae bacterium]MDW8306377.1 ParA family protein [Leptospiraceae bacterium]